MFSGDSMRKSNQPSVVPSGARTPRQGRSRIEITHIHNPNFIADRSHFSSSNSRLDPQEGSTHHGQCVPGASRPPEQDAPLSHELNSRLYALMKEQIEIAALNFREKMGQTLKLQAREIQKLSAIIAHNNKVIRRQQETISSLSRNEDFMTSTVQSRRLSREDMATSKSPRKISITQSRSIKKSNAQREVSPLRGD
jgi:hypothetical protein